jgi:hypothetical protein
MMKSILRVSMVSLLVAVVVSLPLEVLAQSTNKPAAVKKSTADKTDSTAKKKSAHPFRGKLAAVDQTAKTIKIGASVYQVTSQTKITKGGKPATLEDGVVGEETAGYATPTEDGKMAASSLRFGPKAEGTSTAKKKDKTTQK